MDFARYKGGTVLIKWMLCHLTDEAAVQLLTALGDHGCRVYVVDSHCKKKAARRKEPFYERTGPCWAALALKAKMELKPLWSRKLRGLAQQACFHLKRDESASSSPATFIVANKRQMKQKGKELTVQVPAKSEKTPGKSKSKVQVVESPGMRRRMGSQAYKQYLKEKKLTINKLSDRRRTRGSNPPVTKA